MRRRVDKVLNKRDIAANVSKTKNDDQRNDHDDQYNRHGLRQSASLRTWLQFLEQAHSDKQSFYSILYSYFVSFRFVPPCGGTKRKKKDFCEDTSRSSKGAAPAPQKKL